MIPTVIYIWKLSIKLRTSATDIGSGELSMYKSRSPLALVQAHRIILTLECWVGIIS